MKNKLFIWSVVFFWACLVLLILSIRIAVIKFLFPVAILSMFVFLSIAVFSFFNNEDNSAGETDVNQKLSK